MTTTLAPHPTTAGRPRPRRAAHSTAREARKRRSYDAVFASYIRELATAADGSPQREAPRA